MSTIKTPLNPIENPLVSRSEFNEARNQTHQVWGVSGTATESVGKLLITKERLNKSRLVIEVKKCHPYIRSLTAQNIISVKVPSKRTVKGLVEALLTSLGDPCALVGTVNHKNARLMKMLSKTKTRVIVLDNYHHFMEKSSMKAQYYFSGWLKYLLNNSGVTVVVVGLESAAEFNDQNLQRRAQLLPLHA